MNSLWEDKPFAYGQAWIDLIGLANHKEGTIYVRRNIIKIQRGQVGWSTVKLAARWGWSRMAVRTFLKKLETSQQIIQQKNFITSIISIVNYDQYQQTSQQTSQQVASRKPAGSQQIATNKERTMNENEINPYNPLKKNYRGVYVGKSDYDPSPEEAKAILEQINKERFKK